jgi:hypothetical protein
LTVGGVGWWPQFDALVWRQGLRCQGFAPRRTSLPMRQPPPVAPSCSPVVLFAILSFPSGSVSPTVACPDTRPLPRRRWGCGWWSVGSWRSSTQRRTGPSLRRENADLIDILLFYVEAQFASTVLQQSRPGGGQIRVAPDELSENCARGSRAGGLEDDTGQRVTPMTAGVGNLARRPKQWCSQLSTGVK